MPHVKTRSAYKGRLTNIRNTLEKLEQEPQNLLMPGVRKQLEVHLETIGKLLPKYRDVQLLIIAQQVTDTDRESEEADLLSFSSDCDAIEQRLIDHITDLKLRQENEEGHDSTTPSMWMRMLKEERKVHQESVSKILEEQQVKFQTMLNEVTHSRRERRSRDSSRSSEGSVDSESGPTRAAIKLETIKIPKFDGTYSKWQEFQDMFTNIVDENPQLPNAQKMYYLKNSLVDEAKAVIEHIQAKACNYQEAWKTVKERYDNKMNILSNLLETFHSQPGISAASPDDLRKLHDTSRCILSSIKAMKVGGPDPWIIHVMFKKLDYETRTLWIRENTDTSEIPTWDTFDKFLTKRCNALEMCPPLNCSSAKSSKKNVKPSANSKNALANLSAVEANKNICPVCAKGNHKLYKCNKFKSLTAVKRLETALNLKICVNCLATTHALTECKYPPCKHCKQKHNFWLHDALDKESPGTSALSLQIDEASNGKLLKSSVNQGVMSELKKRRVLLKTARILVYDATGKPHVCRAFIDEGAQGDFISARMCAMLGLKKHPINEVVSGLEYQLSSPRFAVEATIASRYTMKPYTLWCRVVDRVSVDLPNWPIQKETLSIPSQFDLADPLWYDTGKIDILIGGYILNEILHDKSYKLGHGRPCLKSSELGWMLFGGWDQQPEVGDSAASASHQITCSLATLASIDNTLKRFWEMEEVSDGVSLSKEHEEVEQLYIATTRRTDEGRYEVYLPLRDNYRTLSSNRRKALQLLRAVERRLSADPALHMEYSKVFQEYLKLGFIEAVPSEELSRTSYYAPHHCVIRKQATSTKVRIVFNFSSKSESGVSLNDVMKIGPVVQPDLVSILWRFRRYSVAMSCDIVKMYLQTQITPSHRDLLRFVWRETPESPVIDYRFRSVCFGNAASPYLATRSLNQLAMDEGAKYPEAARVVKDHFYIDDCLLSAASVDEVIEMQRQLIDMFQTSNLELSKWQSNSEEVLGALTSHMAASEDIHISGDDVKTLGLIWSPLTDSFRFQVSPDVLSVVPTKRTMLSLLARIFDPLGLISPVVVRAKLLLQGVWKAKLDWDVPIQEPLLKDWNSFVADLASVPEIQIPRWASNIQFGQGEELHVFCDASKIAYGAAVYLATVDAEGNRCSHLLTSKSKVAPIGESTIPRLELCAATLGALLMTRVRSVYDISKERCFYWSDARAILGQICSMTTKQETFVRRRVQIIRDNSSISQWRHVSTLENPADLVSRGTTPQRLAQSSLWWRGPTWLVLEEDAWPEPYVRSAEEENSASMVASVDQVASTNDIDEVFEHIMETSTDWTHAKKLAAFVIRENVTEKFDETMVQSAEFTLDELRKAEVYLIKKDQEMQLHDEVTALRKSRFEKNPKFRALRKLRPFLDGDGLLRVGGRLQESEEGYDAIHQIILPRSKLAELIAQFEHLNHHHAGPHLLLASLRRRYWPLGGRYLVRRVVHLCHVCYTRKPKLEDQLMSNLPKPRVTLVRPFRSVGIDFAGPFTIRVDAAARTRTQKAYICVFVCMAVKAVHLEIVSALTTEAFIACFRRFVSRRNLPAEVYSDNGRNFTGADREMQRLFRQEEHQKQLKASTIDQAVQWHFQPPSAPHHGGLYEAAVKSTKYHLKRVVGDTILNFEEFNTIIAQIEATLNCRPLTQLSNEPGDPQPLTPGHFLTMAPLHQVADPDVTDLRINTLSRWQLCQRIYQDFVKRWRVEYLPVLQQRLKWTECKKNLAVGDLVLLCEDGLVDPKWTMGKVVGVHHGADGLVRTVEVSTKKGIFTRPITKLARYPETEIWGSPTPDPPLEC